MLEVVVGTSSIADAVVINLYVVSSNVGQLEMYTCMERRKLGTEGSEKLTIISCRISLTKVDAVRKLFTAEKILPSNLNGFSFFVRLICTQPSGGGAGGRFRVWSSGWCKELPQWNDLLGGRWWRIPGVCFRSQNSFLSTNASRLLVVNTAAVNPDNFFLSFII